MTIWRASSACAIVVGVACSGPRLGSSQQAVIGDGGSGAWSGSGSDAWSGSGSDARSGSGSDAWSGSGSDAATDAPADAWFGSGSDAATDAPADAWLGSGSDAGGNDPSIGIGCVDGNACTIDDGFPSFGCTEQPAPDGTGCVDGNGDVSSCVAGACVLEAAQPMPQQGGLPACTRIPNTNPPSVSSPSDQMNAVIASLNAWIVTNCPARTDQRPRSGPDDVTCNLASTVVNPTPTTVGWLRGDANRNVTFYTRQECFSGLDGSGERIGPDIVTGNMTATNPAAPPPLAPICFQSCTGTPGNSLATARVTGGAAIFGFLPPRDEMPAGTSFCRELQRQLLLKNADCRAVDAAMGWNVRLADGAPVGYVRGDVRSDTYTVNERSTCPAGTRSYRWTVMYRPFFYDGDAAQAACTAVANMAYPTAAARAQACATGFPQQTAFQTTLQASSCNVAPDPSP